MPAQIFLGLSAVVWLPYALLCLLNPDFLAGAAGVSTTSPTGLSEIRAMYGGLQAGIGILALLGAARPGFTRPALLMLLCLATGLGLARVAGVIVDSSLSGYTVGALIFEGITVFFAASCLRRPVRRPHANAAVGLDETTRTGPVRR